MTDHLGDYLEPEFLENKIYSSKAFLHKSYQFKNEESKQRRFFILNQLPQEDDRIIIVNATTKIQRREKARRRQPKVLVRIPAGTRDYIPEDSIIDCESYAIWHKNKFKGMVKNGQIELLAPLPSEIMDKLYKAISHSRTISDLDSRLVFSENNDD